MNTAHPNNEKHKLLMDAWQSAFEPRSIIYLSGPITTGTRFNEWYAKHGGSLFEHTKEYREDHYKHVIALNSEDIIKAAISLRETTKVPVLEPASLVVDGWTQSDYLSLWEEVISEFVSKIVLMPGWTQSYGCVFEVLCGLNHNLAIESISGDRLSVSQIVNTLKNTKLPPSLSLERRTSFSKLIEQFDSFLPKVSISENSVIVRKDQSLNRLAEVANVAQFISFEPLGNEPNQSFSRVLGASPNHKFKSIRDGLSALLEKSADKSINMRSYTPENPKSREFIYGIETLEQAEGELKRLNSKGLYVIANETIDINDGGVSGVIVGDLVEFTPDNTPRGVEEPGAATLPRHWANRLIETVYGADLNLEIPFESRFEFSVHPKPCGWKSTHTLGWEFSRSDFFKISKNEIMRKTKWPNNFSKMLGDKVYGLLIAECAGAKVPHTTVINRRISPFTFGQNTGLISTWIRTAPAVKTPGKFTTTDKWIDPFKLLRKEDPRSNKIPSVLSQHSVPAEFSGAAIVDGNGYLIIEGVKGQGDEFMTGEKFFEDLPSFVQNDIKKIYHHLSTQLGPVGFEWVHDGSDVWVVQLHHGAVSSSDSILFPGEPNQWIKFNIDEGLEALRKKLSKMRSGQGLILDKNVGLTSHIAELIRNAEIPARISQR